MINHDSFGYRLIHSLPTTHASLHTLFKTLPYLHCILTYLCARSPTHDASTIYPFPMYSVPTCTSPIHSARHALPADFSRPSQTLLNQCCIPAHPPKPMLHCHTPHKPQRTLSDWQCFLHIPLQLNAP